MKLKSLTQGLIFIFSLNSYAGVGSSGGGFAVVCRSSSGELKQAELFDLYEGRQQGLTPRSSSSSLEKEFTLAMQRTYELRGRSDVFDATKAINNLNGFLRMVRFTSPGKRLKPLNDLGDSEAFEFAAGCGLEQLAIFHDDSQRVDIDFEIWNSLNSLNRAALVSHEIFYFYDRSIDLKNSEATRARVALIYAREDSKSIFDGLPNEVLACKASADGDSDGFNSKKKTSFYVYRQGKDIILQLDTLVGVPFFTRSTVRLKNISWLTRYIDSGDSVRSIALVVAEANVNEHLRLQIDSEPMSKFEINLDYVSGKEIQIGLSKNGELIEQQRVSDCSLIKTGLSKD